MSEELEEEVSIVEDVVVEGEESVDSGEILPEAGSEEAVVAAE